MLAYLLLIFIPLLTGTVIRLTNGRRFDLSSHRTLPVSLFFLILFFMLSLRAFSVGIDTPVYKNMFQRLIRYNFFSAYTDHIEYGFFVVCKLVSLIGLDFRGLLILIALFTLIVICRAFTEDDAYCFLKIILFANLSVFSLMFSALRQTIAIAIGLIAFRYVRQKKIIPFALCVIAAILFHKSAFMLVLLYPFYYIRIKRNNLIVALLIIVLVFILNQPIFSLLSSFLSEIYPFAKVGSTGAYNMILLLLGLFVFCFIVPSEESLSNDTIAMRNYLFLALCVQLFAPLHSLAMRLNYYYLIFIPMLIPDVLKHASPKMKSMAEAANYVMCLFFVCYFYYNALQQGDTLRIFPYVPFWRG